MNETDINRIMQIQKRKRDLYANLIIKSTHPKKIIVSAPGTGKTDIFHKLLETKQGNCLALTFINNLADKLKTELHNLAKSCTFHSFCKEWLHKIGKQIFPGEFDLFPKLEQVIKSDAKLMLNDEPDFKKSFRTLTSNDQNISFFLDRSYFYKHISFDDCVYRILMYFKKNKDEIPEFEQIVVDEYQDFNRLEVEFIDLLALKSPILIVGDDDQALYPGKFASPKFIREKYADPTFKKFPLPFCSRCPQVIIDSIKDIISKAQRFGKLRSRVNKQIYCYLPKKFEDNKKYPYITFVHCSTQNERSPYAARFIEQQIYKLRKEEIIDANSESEYTILITGPKQYLRQIQDYFKKRQDLILDLYKDIDIGQNKLTIYDGYRILLRFDRYSNLGWRILLECDNSEEMKTHLKEFICNEEIYKNLPKHFRDSHEFNLGVLGKLFKNQEVENQELERVEKYFNENINEIKAKLAEEPSTDELDKIKEQDKISVKFATYVGCKGLSAGFVFILGLNEGNLPKRNNTPTDNEICKFIVALTRTTKKCYLIYTNRFGGKPEGKHSAFIYWISPDRIKPIKVNKDYWK